MRRTVLILMALSLTLMASTSFAKQSRDDGSHKRPHVVQQEKSYNSHDAKYNHGYEKRHQDSGKHRAKITRHDNRKHRYNVAEYRHHRQLNCNSYKPHHRDQRTTIILPTPPIPRVVVYFPW